MTIYRIQQNNNFLIFDIPTKEVLNKLGRQHPFHIDRSPKAYISVWAAPLRLDFSSIEKGEQSQVPNISARNGRLFLDQKAFRATHLIIKDDGEFLSVTYDGKEGFIFNPLKVAEDLNSLDEAVLSYDQYGNLDNFSFVEDKLGDTVIFRAKIDNYYGIFCTDKFKIAVEECELKGINFQPDLADFTTESFSITH